MDAMSYHYDRSLHHVEYNHVEYWSSEAISWDVLPTAHCCVSSQKAVSSLLQPLNWDTALHRTSAHWESLMQLYRTCSWNYRA
ncbi:hypothetical protein HPB50_010371 [Hyalomma asiaticum]|uniref:Uncharacterized protein n=1 Tax=Hyalomma asiaticum TaxID=266040 RepID=A0ACB7T494_HYAAI|nr:hypothetical protein HPB50_010371 [Hyalomma asiaticum]